MLDDGPITGRGYKNEQEVIKTLLKQGQQAEKQTLNLSIN